ncbi:MAG: site-specific integrase [bacterium]|nr:site-specific integrase [bacterium]
MARDLLAVVGTGDVDGHVLQRAADIENLRGSTVLRGRALAGGELAQLFGACADATPKGTRDAAMLSVFYGCGVRRGELARLEVDDFRPKDCSIIVRHGKRRRKQRTAAHLAHACPRRPAENPPQDPHQPPIWIKAQEPRCGSRPPGGGPGRGPGRRHG